MFFYCNFITLRPDMSTLRTSYSNKIKLYNNNNNFIICKYYFLLYNETLKN